MSLVVCSSQAPPPIATMTANGKLRGPNSLRRNSRHLNRLRAFGEMTRVTRDGVKDAAAETRPARMVILAGWEAGKCGRPSWNKICDSRSRWKELGLIVNAGARNKSRGVSSPCFDGGKRSTAGSSLSAPCTPDAPRARKIGSTSYRRYRLSSSPSCLSLLLSLSLSLSLSDRNVGVGDGKTFDVCFDWRT